MYTSPVVFVRGTGSRLISRERSFSARGEKLSAVNTLERLYSVDISHDDRGHPNLAVLIFRNGFDGSTRFTEILHDPQFHQCQSDPSCHRPNVRANFWGCEVPSLVSQLPIEPQIKPIYRLVHGSISIYFELSSARSVRIEVDTFMGSTAAKKQVYRPCRTPIPLAVINAISPSVRNSHVALQFWIDSFSPE